MTKTPGFLLLASLLVPGCEPYQPVSTKPPGKPTYEQTRTADNVQSDQNTDSRHPVTAKDVGAKTRETLELTREFAAQSAEEFAAEAKVRMAEMNRKLADWEAQSKPLAEDAKVRWNEEREVLRQHLGTLQQQLDRLKEKGGNAWEEMKEGSKSAWHDLANAFSKASNHFEKDDSKANP